MYDYSWDEVGLALTNCIPNRIQAPRCITALYLAKDLVKTALLLVDEGLRVTE